MSFRRIPSSIAAVLAASSAILFFLSAAGGASAANDCPVQNDPVSPSIVCTSGNYWCGGTCQAQPVCPGGTGDPYGVKTERNCTSCVCACPADRSNDCTASNQQCQTTNAACSPAHRASVCSTTSGATTQVCGACSSGYFDCGGTCEPTSDPTCPAPGYWDPCLKKCVEKYILSNPTPAQSPQIVNAKLLGDLSMADGNLSVTSSAIGKGDVYVSGGKAIRVDGAGVTTYNIGNWGSGATGLRLNLFGELCLSNGSACRSYWPLGLPESASPGNTLRYDGTNWVANGLLFNNGTDIGIGTTAPAKNLDIRGTGAAVVVRINDATGGVGVYSGLSLARSEAEKWFLGMGDDSNKLLFRRNGSSNDMVIDTAGNVGIGSESPAVKLDVNGSVRMTGFELTTGATDKYVLMSDAAGVGTWRNMIGLPESATAGDTLRYNGANWINNDFLFNDGGRVGIGETAPGYRLDIGGAAAIGTTTPAHLPIVRLHDPAGASLWTGLRLDRDKDTEKWFVGMTDASDKLLFRRAGASDDLIIDTAGNVGVGQANPTFRFEVATGASDTPVFAARDAASGVWIEMGRRSITQRGGDFAINAQEGRLALQTAGIERLSIMNADGNVGIGTTSPDKNLVIRGTTGGVIARLNDEKSGGGRLYTGVSLARSSAEKWFVGMNDTDDKLLLRRTESSNDVVIDTAGNVGIGSETPAQKLDVNGTAQVTGLKMPTGAVNNYVMTTDAAGVGTWRSILFADACTGGKFDHLTALTYDGAQTSYDNVNTNICSGGQHVCTPDEILRSVYCTSSMPLPGTLVSPISAWVANGPPGFTSPASNDCTGWTSKAATSYGAFWEFTGAGGGRGFATSCIIKLPFACCKQ